jgi:hypothetical protein
VTLPSIWRRLATVLFVAFFCEAVFCFFRVGPSSDSCSSNASEDEGEVKIAQNVWELSESISRPRNKTKNDLNKKAASKKIFFNVIWISVPLWIKASKKEVF